ncbi:MAG: ATP-grasp domain-containing protein [candidate division NC10 bacterium]|nr:ATP-grasp domain-containing protein [candidate division NC10 bacterium]MDE2321698.1 ATP-grasp domain-containing protein [candidate division NC10 bacterium]
MFSDESDYHATALHLCALQSSFEEVILVPVDVASVKSVAVAHGPRVLTFPVPSLDAVAQLDDKWAFFNLCTALGIKTPRTKVFDDKYDLSRNWPGEELKYPFVIKPTDKEGSAGFRVITSREHYQETVLGQNYAFKPLVAQSFVPGHDIDISVFGIDGRILHHAVQTYIDGRLWFVHNSEFVHRAATIAEALRLSGIVHIDARVDSRTGELNLIEANPRVWGSMNALTLMGLNFIRAGLEWILTGTTSAARTVTDESVSLAQVALKAMRGGTLSDDQRLFLRHTLFDPPLLLSRLIRRRV